MCLAKCFIATTAAPFAISCNVYYICLANRIAKVKNFVKKAKKNAKNFALILKYFCHG